MNAPAIDWRAPDFTPIYLERARRLREIRARPSLIPALMAYYKLHPEAMIDDWAVTVDPRVSGKGRSAMMPFVMFPRQRELAQWILERWRKGEPGIVVKSRDVGASWIFIALCCSLCLTHDDLALGLGTYMQDKLDRAGDPDCLMYKARMFMTYLPPEISGGWSATNKQHTAENRLYFPLTRSSITGQIGDNIGRGGRKAIYGVDESAHLERPKLVDASLSATTDCRIDFSSVNGSANSFYERWQSGKIPVFIFHWRDDPRKPPDFIEQRIEQGDDPAMLSQEYDLDPTGMQDGQIIPARLVNLALDAHVKLGIKPTGLKRASFDIADVGKDKCASAVAHGPVLTYAEEWSGQLGDTLQSTTRAFDVCDRHEVTNLIYDADGLGGPTVRDMGAIVNKARVTAKRKPINVHPYKASNAVMWPEQPVPGAKDRKNEDLFQNFGAQTAWALKRRFEETARALAGKPYDPDQIISISSEIPAAIRGKLMVELSQPVWKRMETGKLKRDKTPDGASSPNLADAVMMLYAPVNRGWRIPAGTADRMGWTG